LLLARMELGAFLPDGAQGVADITSVVESFPQLAGLRGFGRLGLNVRPDGTQAYIAGGPLMLLPDLIRRVSFVQRIYCVIRDTEKAQGFLNRIRDDVGPVVIYHADEGFLIAQAVPHYALFELSGVVARRSKGARETRRNLGAMLEALLGKTAEKRSVELAQTALSARSTTSHLSHDIHYYKAKFFPRLARSLLNICAQRLGDGPHRVVDPFVGSGTALLEAATLGIPSVGLDIDPLSVLISETKLEVAQLDSGLLAKEVARAIEILDARARGQLRLFDAPLLEERPISFPTWLMKNRKMTPDIAQQMSREIGLIQAAVANSDPRARSLFRVLMSDAISRKIRMRFLGTGVGRFSLTFAKTPTPQIFARSLERYVQVVTAFEWLRETIHLSLAGVQVIEADARRLPENLGTFDILVTSPPYLPASSGRESYAKARAPSLIALGIKNRSDVDDLVDDSIGSMNGEGVDLTGLTEGERHIVEWLRHDKLRSIKAEPTARYFVDLRQAFAEMYRILTPGALAVVVSGKQSTFYNFSTRETLYVVRSAEFLAEEAQGVGFEVEALHDVQLSKANMNARPRALDDYYETLIVLRKPW